MTFVTFLSFHFGNRIETFDVWHLSFSCLNSLILLLMPRDFRLLSISLSLILSRERGKSQEVVFVSLHSNFDFYDRLPSLFQSPGSPGWHSLYLLMRVRQSLSHRDSSCPCLLHDYHSLIRRTDSSQSLLCVSHLVLHFVSPKYSRRTCYDDENVAHCYNAFLLMSLSFSEQRRGRTVHENR